MSTLTRTTNHRPTKIVRSVRDGSGRNANCSPSLSLDLNASLYSSIPILSAVKEDVPLDEKYADLYSPLL